MSFSQFNDIQYVRTMDSSETTVLCGFSTAKSMELAHARITLLVNGTVGGSEQIRGLICSDVAGSQVIYTGDYMNLSAITNLSTGDWYGYLTLDFNREELNKNNTYYFAVQTNNYTRNGDTYYLAVAYDWPFPIYQSFSANLSNIGRMIAVYGYVNDL